MTHWNQTHGMSSTTTYASWVGMRARCGNPNATSYEDYGGRGIKVCERWQASFEAFYQDMGHRPEGTTLDRFPDPDGDYEPGNCRWATWHQQANNKRNNQLVTLGDEEMSIAEAARRSGIRAETLTSRLSSGITGDSLFAPPLPPHEQRRIAIDARVAAGRRRMQEHHDAARLGGPPCRWWCKLCSPEERRITRNREWAEKRGAAE